MTSIIIMPNLFKDILKENESLIVDPIALDYDYQPKLIPYREQHQQHMVSCIKPLFQDRNGKNLIIVGQSGMGKTVSTRHVLLELENETDIIPIYINCWKTETPYKIILEICSKLNYKFTQNKDTNELLNEITRILNKKSAVFCFDEIDKIKDISIIYNLLNEIYKKTILLITNNKDFLSTLDPRIKSRLTPEILEFKPYNLEETRGILKQRSEYAFIHAAFEDSAFESIIQKTYELKDIRSGLFLLKESALIAESSSLKKINLEHAKQAIKKLTDFKIKSSSDLENEDRDILNIVKENQEKTIKELYEIYAKTSKENMSYRSFCRKIDSLEKSSLISKREVKDVAGKATIIAYSKIKRLDEF